MKFNALMPELYVTNFEKSLFFYTTLLGFKVEYTRANPAFAFLSFQGAQVMLQELKPGEAELKGLTKPFGRGVNFEIDTPRLEDLLGPLESHGYALHKEVRECWRYAGQTGKQYGSKEFVVHDPDGYELRFSQDLGERNLPSQ